MLALSNAVISFDPDLHLENKFKSVRRSSPLVRFEILNSVKYQNHMITHNNHRDHSSLFSNMPKILKLMKATDKIRNCRSCGLGRTSVPVTACLLACIEHCYRLVGLHGVRSLGSESSNTPLQAIISRCVYLYKLSQERWLQRLPLRISEMMACLRKSPQRSKTQGKRSFLLGAYQLPLAGIALRVGLRVILIQYPLNRL